MKKIFIVLAFTCFSFVSVYSEENISSFLINSAYSNDKIEILIQKPATRDNKLLLVLHGGLGKGLNGLSQSFFDHFLAKGYAIAAISMPGFGESTGIKDFCGPFTLNSLNSAIDFIKAKLEVSDFGIIGFGQGGLAGLLLSLKREDMNCLVCANGVYDLFRHKVLLSKLREIGYDFDINDDEALSLRSPMSHLSDLNTPTVILYRKNHPTVSAQEVSDFYNAMIAAGKSCDLLIKDNKPDCDMEKITYEEVLETEDWIDDLMGLSKQAIHIPIQDLGFCQSQQPRFRLSEAAPIYG
ncbi:MAG: alpha/beta fold hydrolase [Simkaniaceae bacterium]|nr:alpha/beta fold hydrolase [Simkaniaceae bacterium]